MLNDNSLVNTFKHELEEVRSECKRLRKQNAEQQQIIEMLQSAEKILSANQERLHTTLNSIGDGVISTDIKGGITGMNPVAEKLTGWKYDQVKGKPLAEVLHIVNAHTKEVCSNPALLVLQSGSVVGLANHTLLISKDGSEYQIADSASPIRAADGTITGVVLVFRDVTEEYRIQESLRQNRESLEREIELFENLFQTIPDLMYIKGRDSKFIRMNRSMVKFFKLQSEQEGIGKSDFDFYTEHHARTAYEDEQVIMQTGIPKIEYEEKETWPGGGVTWSLSTKMPLRDNDDNVVGLIGISHDITKRKNMELALVDSELRYRTLFESSADAIYLLNDKMFMDCNPKTFEMFGCRPHDLVGRTPMDFSPPMQPDGRESSGKAIEKIHAALDGQPQSFYWQHQKLDSTLFEVEINLNRIELPSGIYLQAVMRDVTEQKKAEKELAATKGLLEAAIAQSPSGILIADAPNVAIRLGNAAAFGIRGGDQELLTDIDVTQHSIQWQTYYPDGSPYPSEELPLSRAVMRGEHTRNEELVICDMEGNKHWINTNAAPIRDAEGKITAGIVVFHDITDRKQIEKEREHLLQALETKNEELQSIVYVASHDLRSPLVNINGFGGILTEHCQELGILLEKTTFVEDQKNEIEMLLKESIPEDLYFIQSSSDKIETLLDGLLQVSRIGTVPIKPVTIHMNEMIENIIKTMHFQINQSGVQIAADPLPDCVGDRTQIDQVFVNLIDNAMKYMDPDRKGAIHITGQTIDGQIVYCIEDNGIGIDQEHQKKIFEIFHRLHPTGPATGQGLGLTIVKRIMDRHNGQIRVESSSGSGSKFYVSLPV